MSEGMERQREAFEVARALGPIIGGDDGASWDDDDLLRVPREWVRRAYRLAVDASDLRENPDLFW